MFLATLASPILLSVLAYPIGTTPNWKQNGGEHSAWLGYALTSAGDVDGDGFGDIAVSAPGHSFNTGVGRVFVYRGAPGGLSNLPSSIIDGATFSEQLGAAVASAGDLNGDGYADLVIGSTTYSNGQTSEGRVQVFLGSPAGLATTSAWSVESNLANAQLGASVSSAGDVNADGFLDLVVGLPGATQSQLGEGYAMVFLGTSLGLPSSPSWVNGGFGQLLAHFGAGVRSAGDPNADGFSDVLVSSSVYPGTANANGGVFLFAGSPAGPLATPLWSKGGNGSVAFGRAMDAADFDGDGLDDLLVSEAQFAVQGTVHGRVLLLQGTSLGYAANPSWIGLSAGSQNLGYALGHADIDGDGRPDVLAGDPYYGNSPLSAGRAHAFRNGAGGLGSTPYWTITGTQSVGTLGFSVAGAGDVNGDLVDDILVGEPHLDGPGGFLGDEGQVQLYHGCIAASATAYGAGKAGTVGVPVLTSLEPPVLGGTTDLTITGGLPNAGTVFFFAGGSPVAIPFDHGTLLVAPSTIFFVPALDAAGNETIAFPLPSTQSLCGLDLYLQAGFVDPGAVGPYHTALTQGQHWKLGS